MGNWPPLMRRSLWARPAPNGKGPGLGRSAHSAAAAHTFVSAESLTCSMKFLEIACSSGAKKGKIAINIRLFYINANSNDSLHSTGGKYPSQTAPFINQYSSDKCDLPFGNFKVFSLRVPADEQPLSTAGMTHSTVVAVKQQISPCVRSARRRGSRRRRCR